MLIDSHFVSPEHNTQTLLLTEKNTLRNPIAIAVTGAGGQIGYSLLFRLAAGELLGCSTLYVATTHAQSKGSQWRSDGTG